MTTETELAEIHTLIDSNANIRVVNHGFGESGEIAAQGGVWSKLRADPIPAFARAKVAKMIQPQYVTIAAAMIYMWVPDLGLALRARP
eukprot:7374720-Prymnesium_polylepis.1